MMELLKAIPWWIWFLLSVIPCFITRQKNVQMQVFTLIALSWQFSFSRKKSATSWSFALPWLACLRHNRTLQKLFTSTWIKLIQEWVKQILSQGK